MKTQNHHIPIILFLLLFLFLLSGTGQAVEKQAPLRVAIAAMISPKSTFIYYKEILNLIAAKTGRPVELVQRQTYAEVNELLKTREVELAFVCAGPYVAGHADFGLELLVAPMAYGETVYYAYIIVNHLSTIQNFAELKDKSFAFTDPHSNTGCLVPTYQLALLNETPASYFQRLIFSGSHDNSIKAVAQNIVTGAAVDHLIWKYEQATNPKFTNKTKVIAKFGPFAIPPVVVHPMADPVFKKKMQQLFLELHKDPQGKKILSKLNIDRFVLVEDQAYDSVRQMEKWLQKRSKP